MITGTTLRDLFAMVITGTSLNVATATATDMLAMVVDNSGANPTLRVSGISGTSGASFTGGTVGDMDINGAIRVYGSSGTGGWTPIGTSGDGIALANGIVTYISVPTWPTSGSSGTSGDPGTNGSSGTSGAAGSPAYSVQNITGSTYTGTTLNYYRASGTTDFYLPAASGSGEWIMIKNLYNTLTIRPSGSETIDGTSTKTMNLNDSNIFIDGSSGGWDIN